MEIRASNNIYNQSLVASLITNNGKGAIADWSKGVVSNMARDPKGNESVYFSREKQTLRRNTSKRCQYVNGITTLTTEACSEVQALIASHLVTKCK